MEETELFKPGDPVEFKWHTAAGMVLLRGIFREYANKSGYAKVWCEELDTEVCIQTWFIINRRHFEVLGEHTGS